MTAREITWPTAEDVPWPVEFVRASQLADEGASYQASLMPDEEHVPVDQERLADLAAELNQTVHSVLADAGLDVAPQHTSDPYVSDAYFDAETGEGHREIVGMDLAHVKHRQESVVVKHLKDGLSGVSNLDL